MSNGLLVVRHEVIEAAVVKSNETALVSHVTESPTVIQSGQQGPPGPAGYAGSQFIQSAPAAVWTVNHNLGHYVNAKVYSAGGVEMWAEIIQPNTNQLLIYFDGPQTGYVIY
jgi:hypothetical protein